MNTYKEKILNWYREYYEYLVYSEYFGGEEFSDAATTTDLQSSYLRTGRNMVSGFKKGSFFSFSILYFISNFLITVEHAIVFQYVRRSSHDRNGRHTIVWLTIWTSSMALCMYSMEETFIQIFLEILKS